MYGCECMYIEFIKSVWLRRKIVYAYNIEENITQWNPKIFDCHLEPMQNRKAHPPMNWNMFLNVFLLMFQCPSWICAAVIKVYNVKYKGLFTKVDHISNHLNEMELCSTC